MKYIGKRKALKAHLSAHGILGSWTREPNKVHMMRCADGSGLHSSKTSGTVWFDGPMSPKLKLAGRVAIALSAIDSAS